MLEIVAIFGCILFILSLTAFIGYILLSIVFQNEYGKYENKIPRHISIILAIINFAMMLSGLLIMGIYKSIGGVQ